MRCSCLWALREWVWRKEGGERRRPDERADAVSQYQWFSWKLYNSSVVSKCSVKEDVTCRPTVCLQNSSSSLKWLMNNDSGIWRPPKNESTSATFKFKDLGYMLNRKRNHNIIKCFCLFWKWILDPDVTSHCFSERLLNSCVFSSRWINHKSTECVSVSKLSAELKLLHVDLPEHMRAESDSWHVFCMVIMWSTFSQSGWHAHSPESQETADGEGLGLGQDNAAHWAALNQRGAPLQCIPAAWRTGRKIPTGLKTNESSLCFTNPRYKE